MNDHNNKSGEEALKRLKEIISSGCRINDAAEFSSLIAYFQSEKSAPENQITQPSTVNDDQTAPSHLQD